MIGRKTLLLVLLLLLAAPAVWAADGSSVYVGLSAGIWKWDRDIATRLGVEDRSGFVYGGRLGYSPIEAFAGELVVLTGTNDGTLSPNDSTLALRLTQVEFSMLVNFQSLVSSPLYPFLDLGVGLAMRSGGFTEGETSIFDETKFVFHIGGGLKADLTDRVGLRFNLRDTFFTETQLIGNEENQVTVDSVEISAGLEYRMPLSASRGSKRLR